MSRVVLAKIKEADNPLHPNNISSGMRVIGDMYRPPEVGERFNIFDSALGIQFITFSTSAVQKIHREVDTPFSVIFETHNSIYKVFDYEE